MRNLYFNSVSFQLIVKVSYTAMLYRKVSYTSKLYALSHTYVVRRCQYVFRRR